MAVRVMSPETIRKCKEAIDLVYEGKYSLRKAAEVCKMSSHTIYEYVEDHLNETERVAVRKLSRENAKQNWK